MVRRQKSERRRASAKRRVDTHTTGGGSKYIDMPEGFGFFQAKAGKYRLDFMSYEVTKGKGQDGGNPYFEKGELAFERTFFIHRDIGPNKDWHLCAAKTFNEPCPVCEYRAKLARDPNVDEEVMKELAPKERQLWIVKDLSEDELFVWEFSHHLFGKQLDAKIRSGDEEDEYEFFADPVDGLTVRVNFEQSDRGKWIEATDIEFRTRREKYTEDVADEMPDLDAMLVKTDYDKLKKLFLQTDDADEGDDDVDDDTDEEETKPKKRGRPKKSVPTADECGLEEGDQVEYEGILCEIVRISKDGTSLTLEDDDGETYKAIGADDVVKPAPKKKRKPEPVEQDDEDEDDEGEEPPKSRKRGATTRTKTSRSDDDDDDDEPEPPKKRRAASAKKGTSKPTKGKSAATSASPSDKDEKKSDDDWDDWDD